MYINVNFQFETLRLKSVILKISEIYLFFALIKTYYNKFKSILHTQVIKRTILYM